MLYFVHKGHSAKVTFPIKRRLINCLANALRMEALKKNESYLDIVGFLKKQFAKWKDDSDFHVEIVEAEDLPGRLAETIPSEHVIRIRDTIYLDALKGDGFARQVIAHELWHYLVHNANTVSFAYVDESSHIPAEMDPEKQANAFAAEFLAPSSEVYNMPIQQICSKYGVTQKTAKVQRHIGKRDSYRSSRKQTPYIKKKRSGRIPNRYCR